MTQATEAATYISKALRTLSAARSLLTTGDTEGACNRAYFAMFNTAHAALAAAGIDAPDAA